jgi:hypothetical protein
LRHFGTSGCCFLEILLSYYTWWEEDRKVTFVVKFPLNIYAVENAHSLAE